MSSEKKSLVFPKKILKSDTRVVIDIYDFYHYDYFYTNYADSSAPRVRIKTFLLLKKGEFLGRVDLRINPSGYHQDEHKDWFREFLKKFGKRLLIDDIFDPIFHFRRYLRYQINFQTLLAGCRCFKRNPGEFIKNVRKAKNEEEFLILAGLF